MKEISNDIPKIDLPEDWIIGKLTEQDKGLLNLYANYPCRLKAGIVALCLKGRIEASVDLRQFTVEPGSIITLVPGTIFQVHLIEGDLLIYFMGFSSDFLSQAHISKAIMEIHHIVKDNPVYTPKPKALPLLENYFNLLIETYQFCGPKISRNLTNHLFGGLLIGINSMYKEQISDTGNLSKSEQISKNFVQLVIQNYTTQRNVAWYAKQLNITQAHLSTIVKQATGKTCVEVITSMVIMDAKAQLKSTELTIHDIAESLHFSNMSFFGKYFKRYVGMSPQEYRNS